MQRRGEDEAEPQRYTFARAVLPQRIKSLPAFRLTAIWEAFPRSDRQPSLKQTRTSLTLMGIIVGVTAVIAVVTIIKGLDKTVAQTFSSQGSTVFTVSKTSTNNYVARRVHKI